MKVKIKKNPFTTMIAKGFCLFLSCCACRCVRSWQQCWSLNHMPKLEQSVSLHSFIVLLNHTIIRFLCTENSIFFCETFIVSRK